MSAAAPSPSQAFDVATTAQAGRVSSGDVRALSNLLRLRRRPSPRVPSVVEPTGIALVQAVALALGTGGRPAEPAAVAAFSDYNAARHTHLAGVFAAMRGPSMAFSAVVVVSPGNTAMLMTPGVVPADAATRDVAAECVARACDAARAAGATLAQALPGRGGEPVVDLLTQRCRFRRLAELVYLHKRVSRPADVRPLPAGWTVVTYAPERRERFAEALRLSYEGSLDCPELAGLRTMDETIDGHMAAGSFEASAWQVLLDEHDRPAGVLLLSGLGGDGTAGREVVYVGVARRARGRGVGGLLMDRAEAAAASTKGGLLALAVDARNTPGLRLYARRGLAESDRRTALIRDLRPAG